MGNLDAPHEYVELIVLISFTIVGLSHVLQPKMWVDFFTELADQGHRGVVANIVTYNLTPAVVIVTLHPVWTGPAVVLTVVGWMMLLKCALALWFPNIGLRSLQMAGAKSTRGFVAAGGMLLSVAAMCGWALLL